MAFETKARNIYGYLCAVIARHPAGGLGALKPEELAIRRPRLDPRDRGQQGPRVNNRIRVPQVRVVGAQGEMLGVLENADAQRLAREAGLDLVEVNPKSYPPVCKIMDYGKFKYEEKKRTSEARKRQTNVELKEIELRPKTDDHDLDFKLKHVIRFLEEGNKVKITCRFRGREITHPETAQRQLDFIVEHTQEQAIVETPPRMEGRTMTLILAPSAKVAKARPKPAVQSADAASMSAEVAAPQE